MKTTNTILDNFFIGDTYEVNWEYVMTIPEFQDMEKTEQDKKWHGEGNVLNHTKRSIDAAYTLIETNENYSSWLLDAKRYLVLSVLFHDIGKPATTTTDEKGIHSYGHEKEGERITRRILWDLNPYKRELVCANVRYHMDILKVIDMNNFIEELLRMSHNVMLKDLCFIKRCDILGSIPENKDENNTCLSIIRKIEVIIDQLKCNRKPFELFSSCFLPYQYCERTIDFLFNRKKIKTIINENYHEMVRVIVMIGLPGSGKDTYINEHLNNEKVVILSRDDIRAELGLCEKGEKIVASSFDEDRVTTIFNTRLINAVSDKKTVIINNINLKKKYRKAYKSLLKDYNVYWEYIYIQPTTLKKNIERRNGQIDSDVFEKMIHTFDWPRGGEYYKLNIITN